MRDDLPRVDGRAGVQRALSAFGLLLLLLAGCRPVQTTPLLYGDRGLDAALEKSWSRSALRQQEMRKRGWVAEDPDWERLFDAIVFEAGVLDTAHFDYRTEILRGNSINASAWSNGVIQMHQALLCFVRDEAELATILDHELAHVVRQHARARMDFDSLDRGKRVLSTLTSGWSDLGQNIRKRATAFTRANEVEADSLGLVWLLAKGYDAQAVLDLWERMDSLSFDFEGEAYELYANHKNVGERIVDFERMIGDREGGERYRHVDEAEFHRLQLRLLPNQLGILLSTIHGQLDGDRPDSSAASPMLEAFLGRLEELDPGNPDLPVYRLRAALALHGQKDGSLERADTELAGLRAERPGDVELRLAEAYLRERQERWRDALDLYLGLRDDPAFEGRRGSLAIRIRRIKRLLETKETSRDS